MLNGWTVCVSWGNSYSFLYPCVHLLGFTNGEVYIKPSITRQHCQREYWNSNRLGISEILQHLSILCLSVGNIQEFNDEINIDIPHMYVSVVVDILTFLEWNYESPIYASLS